ncbi:MAG: PQQ-binding-like beta-propeller repeat protein [Nitrososphaeraceae archaeon]
MNSEDSWLLFRGNEERSGVFAGKLSRELSLFWVIELEPMISSPIFHNNIVYNSTITGKIFAVNAYRKKIVWQKNIENPLVSSLLLHDDLLISCTFNSWIIKQDCKSLEKNLIYALDITKEGKEEWKVQIPGDIFSSPCVCDGKIIVVGSLDSKIYAIDLRGNIIWTFNTGGSIWSSPSTNNQEIFIGSDDCFLYNFDLNGNLNWKTMLEGKIRATPTLMKSTNYLFIGTHNGIMYCLDRSDGSIKWKYQIGKPILSSVATSKDHIFFGCSDKCIYSLNSTDGSIKWKYETGDKIWSSPVITRNGGILFVGSLDSHIYGLDVETGRVNWKFPTMDSIESSPCIAKNMLFIGSDDGLLYCFSN